MSSFHPPTARIPRPLRPPKLIQSIPRGNTDRDRLGIWPKCNSKYPNAIVCTDNPIEDNSIPTSHLSPLLSRVDIYPTSLDDRVHVQTHSLQVHPISTDPSNINAPSPDVPYQYKSIFSKRDNIDAREGMESTLLVRRGIKGLGNVHVRKCFQDSLKINDSEEYKIIGQFSAINSKPVKKVSSQKPPSPPKFSEECSVQFLDRADDSSASNEEECEEIDLRGKSPPSPQFLMASPKLSPTPARQVQSYLVNKDRDKASLNSPASTTRLNNHWEDSLIFFDPKTQISQSHTQMKSFKTELPMILISRPDH